MKVFTGPYATHIASDAVMRAHALRIERADAAVFAFTSHDRDVTISGTTYLASQGLDASSLASAPGFGIDNLEITTLDDGSLFTQVDVLSGRWHDAKFTLFEYDPQSPTTGIDTKMTGLVGEVTLGEGTVTVELLGLQVFFNQPVGNVSTKTCRANFADFPRQNGRNRCGLVAATYTTTGTVTAVASNQAFTAAALAGAADLYGEGIVTWTSGPSNGLSARIKTHGAGGVIGLSQPMISAIAIGHTFSIIQGCRKRFDEDCVTKYGNGINFAGEPHRPTTDGVTAPEEAEA